MTANCEINSPMDSDTNARQRHDPHTNHQLMSYFFRRTPDNDARFGVHREPVTRTRGE